jgi:hypothetical protein
MVADIITEQVTTNDGESSSKNNDVATTEFSVEYQETDKEIEQVQEIVDVLSSEEIESLPDQHMILRHLRAEKGDVKKGIQSVQRTLKWRKEFRVEEVKSCFLDKVEEEEEKKDGADEEDLASIIRRENETGKLYLRGHDADGRAILYMRPGKENTKHEVDNMRHLVFHMEKAVACSASRGRSKLCIIIDYEGFQLRHAPPLSTSKL